MITGPVELQAVRPDGTDYRTLLDDGQVNTVPRWSSDSKSLFFHRLDFADLLSGWKACEMDFDTGEFVAIENLAHTIDVYRAN